jgi:hypothetical protein
VYFIGTQCTCGKIGWTTNPPNTKPRVEVIEEKEKLEEKVEEKENNPILFPPPLPLQIEDHKEREEDVTNGEVSIQCENFEIDNLFKGETQVGDNKNIIEEFHQIDKEMELGEQIESEILLFEKLISDLEPKGEESMNSIKKT